MLLGSFGSRPLYRGGSSIVQWGFGIGNTTSNIPWLAAVHGSDCVQQRKRSLPGLLPTEPGQPDDLGKRVPNSTQVCLQTPVWSYPFQSEKDPRHHSARKTSTIGSVWDVLRSSHKRRMARDLPVAFGGQSSTFHSLHNIITGDLGKKTLESLLSEIIEARLQ